MKKIVSMLGILIIMGLFIPRLAMAASERGQTLSATQILQQAFANWQLIHLYTYGSSYEPGIKNTTPGLSTPTKVTIIGQVEKDAAGIIRSVATIHNDLPENLARVFPEQSDLDILLTTSTSYIGITEPNSPFRLFSGSFFEATPEQAEEIKNQLSLLPYRNSAYAFENFLEGFNGDGSEVEWFLSSLVKQKVLRLTLIPDSANQYYHLQILANPLTTAQRKQIINEGINYLKNTRQLRTKEELTQAKLDATAAVQKYDVAVQKSSYSIELWIETNSFLFKNLKITSYQKPLTRLPTTQLPLKTILYGFHTFNTPNDIDLLFSQLTSKIPVKSYAELKNLFLLYY